MRRRRRGEAGWFSAGAGSSAGCSSAQEVSQAAGASWPSDDPQDDEVELEEGEMIKVWRMVMKLDQALIQCFNLYSILNV